MRLSAFTPFTARTGNWLTARRPHRPHRPHRPGRHADGRSGRTRRPQPSLVSNTGQTAHASLRLFLTSDYAQAFTTGGNDAGYAGYKLTRVDLLMLSMERRDAAGLHGAHSLGLVQCPGRQPGHRADAAGQCAQPPPGLVRFNASGDGIDLAANTRYWLVVGRQHQPMRVGKHRDYRVGCRGFRRGRSAGALRTPLICEKRIQRTNWASPNTHQSSVALAIPRPDHRQHAPREAGPRLAQGGGERCGGHAVFRPAAEAQRDPE